MSLCMAHGFHRMFKNIFIWFFLVKETHFLGTLNFSLSLRFMSHVWKYSWSFIFGFYIHDSWLGVWKMVPWLLLCINMILLLLFMNNLFDLSGQWPDKINLFVGVYMRHLMCNHLVCRFLAQRVVEKQHWLSMPLLKFRFVLCEIRCFP